MIFQKDTQRLRRFDQDILQIVIDILQSPHFEDFIVNANRLQLEFGIDSEDKPITPFYTPVTVGIKRSKGQQSRWVTLKDTGAFHRSFKVLYRGNQFEVTATDPKTEDLTDKYGDKIFGINDRAAEALGQELERALQFRFDRALFGRTA